MLYPFLELADGTVIVHSEVLEGEKVQVRIEKPDEKLCFKTATCWLPSYEWENVRGFDKKEIRHLQQKIESMAHIIIRHAREALKKGGEGMTLDEISIARMAMLWELRLLIKDKGQTKDTWTTQEILDLLDSISIVRKTT